MRKLALPLAVCVVLGAGASPAMAAKSTNIKQNESIGKLGGALKGVQKAISILSDINAGQTDSVNKAHAKADSLKATVDAIVAVAGSALPALEKGLKDLAAAVQGPGVAGQLGAAGTSAPGSSNTATPSTLPTGTVYRQIVLANAPGSAANGAPLGVRLWSKMPEVAGLYSNNEWVCVEGRGTGKVGGGALDSQVACPSGTAT